MPAGTPRIKHEAVTALGGEVILRGDSFQDAASHARELATRDGLAFIHPYDDPDVIAGQGTVALEILRQHREPIHAVFVSIGGGGLAAGMAVYIKRLYPEIRVIGVEPEDAPSMHASLAAGHPVDLPDVGRFADGAAVKRVGDETFRLCNDLLDEVMLVNNDAICAAIKDVFEETRSILEPAGALAIAGAKAYCGRDGITGRTLVAVASGANMNFDRLRFVAERAEIGEQREALFAVTIPEERGSFKRFCGLIGTPAHPRQVTEFNYRIADQDVAHVFVGLAISRHDEADRIARNFVRHGFATVNLSEDELAKEHVRHMVGGHSELARHERLFRFVFPERPGALMRFLSTMHPGWNISLFHYRNQGADYGRILVGIQVPAADESAFQSFLKTLAYPYVEESANPVYRLFLR
jgi:threonine dehydratase